MPGREAIPKVANWGRWGKGDCCGCQAGEKRRSLLLLYSY